MVWAIGYHTKHDAQRRKWWWWMGFPVAKTEIARISSLEDLDKICPVVLSPEPEEYLKKHHIYGAISYERGYRTVFDNKVLPALGFSPKYQMLAPCLL